MKFLCALKNALLIIRDRFGLSFATKGLDYLVALYLPLPLLVHDKLSYYQTTCYQLFQCLQKFTLLKTTCNFLLLLVGFDILSYWKDYDWSPILVGHQQASPAAKSWGGNTAVAAREPTTSVFVSSFYMALIPTTDSIFFCLSLYMAPIPTIAAHWLQCFGSRIFSA